MNKVIISNEIDYWDRLLLNRVVLMQLPQLKPAAHLIEASKSSSSKCPTARTLAEVTFLVRSRADHATRQRSLAALASPCRTGEGGGVPATSTHGVLATPVKSTLSSSPHSQASCRGSLYEA